MQYRAEPSTLPSGATPPSWFDRLATIAATTVARGGFFAVCVILVVGWASTYFLIRDLNTWQLIINTATTIITFLMVALLQNSQYRADQAIQKKLNAIADALAELMESNRFSDPHDVAELRQAVGLEHREGT